MHDPSLVRFRAVVGGALAHLESRRTEINDLNVFPVADGDRGDNMALTLQAVLAELDVLAGAEGLIDEIGRAEIVESVPRTALLRARGNSGVIHFQLIRGVAAVLGVRDSDLLPAIAASGSSVWTWTRSAPSPSPATMSDTRTQEAERAARLAPAAGATAPVGEAVSYVDGDIVAEGEVGGQPAYWWLLAAEG